MTTPRGGWNRAAPAGAVRCTCPTRRRLWATLDPEAARPCCALPCCTAAQAVITATREQVLALRARLEREAFACPRCGHLIASHQRNFECLDPVTRAARAIRERRRQRATTRSAAAAAARRPSPAPR